MKVGEVMLGIKLNFNISVNNNKYSFPFTIKVLKNIYNLINISPFEFISNFINCNNDELKTYLIQLIMCISNLEIPLNELAIMVTDDNKFELKENLMRFINLEFKSEIEVDIDESNENNNNNVETNKIKSWINWYNFNYYVALYQLNMSEEEFEELTVRELKTLIELHKTFNKNILLSAYIDVNKSKSNNNKSDNNTISSNSNNNIRLKDVFLSMRN